MKIFIGNITEGGGSESNLRSMFEKYGPVSECSILSNFGFVVNNETIPHMRYNYLLLCNKWCAF